MTNKPMLSVERELLERISFELPFSGTRLELRALLDKSVEKPSFESVLQLAFELGGTDEGNYFLDEEDLLQVIQHYAQHQGGAFTYSSKQATNCAGCGLRKHTPLRVDDMGGYVCLTCIDNRLGELLEAEQHQDETVTIEAVAVTRDNGDGGLRLEWLLEGGIAQMEFAGMVLFAIPEANDLCDEDGSAEVYLTPQQVENPASVANGTTSDKYKAELYDEVWQKARDMGFANVTDALAKLGEPVAKFKPDTVVCRRYTLEGQIFYHYDLDPVYGSVPVTVSELIDAAQATPVAVVMPERMKESRAYGHDLGGNYDEGKADGYNIALDDVARLNGVSA